MTQEEFHKRYQYNPSSDCLGEGGFGKVYKAYDTHRDRYVAIKMAEVKPHLAEVRLKKEVEMISKLPTHPNIAYYEECYSFATFAGEYDFGILQYYEEGNLKQLIHSAQLTDEQKDSILRQILDGIAFLHQQGVIHRDLKPQNILIVNRNGAYIPKITDFGISKQLDASHSSVYTNSLTGAGTLAFASPEQLCGQEIRKNTDMWSFGVIASWLFTSKLPFKTSTEVPNNEGERIELYKQITKGEIGISINHLPSNWYSVVKQCLIVDCDKRIADASGCIELLSGVSIEVNPNAIIAEPKVVPKQKEKNRRFTSISPIKAIGSFVRKWKIAIIAVLVITLIPVGLYLHWDYKYHYNFAYSFSEGLAAVKKGDKWGFIDGTGNLVIPYKFKGVEPVWNQKNDVMEGVFHEGLGLVYNNDKKVFINRKGQVVFELKYDPVNLACFYHGLLGVQIKEGKYGFLNKKGKIVSAVYDNIGSFSDGLAAVCKEGLIGFVDTTGKEVIKCKFKASMDFGPCFINGIAVLNDVDRYTDITRVFYINHKGDILLKLNPNIVSEGYNFENGFALLSLRNYSYVLIDMRGKFVRNISTKGTIVSSYGGINSVILSGFIEGFGLFRFHNSYEFIDIYGYRLGTSDYIKACYFCEGRAAVQNKLEKWGFINENGAEITPLKYDKILNYREGLAVVGIGVGNKGDFSDYNRYKWGFVDKSGKEVLPCQFEEAESFSEGFARVKNSDKNGYYFIDKNGKTIGSWY